MAPGAIYQFERSTSGAISFSFISEGIMEMHPGLNPEDLRAQPELGLLVIHAEDRDRVLKSFLASFHHLTPWSIEYRVPLAGDRIAWHWAQAQPERKDDGTVVWYGTFQDITPQQEYTQTLEQILFDISHVMRRPVATMLGLTGALEREEALDEDQLRELSGQLKTVSEELNEYIKELNANYRQLQHQTQDRP